MKIKLAEADRAAKFGEQHAVLSRFHRELVAREDQIKTRLLIHAGVLDRFNPELQSMPDWSAIDNLLRPVDVHYDAAAPGPPVAAAASAPRRSMRRTVRTTCSA